MPEKNNLTPSHLSKNYLKPFLKAAQTPLFLILLSIILGIYLAASSYFHKTHSHSLISSGLSKAAAVLLIFSLFWLAVRLINTLTQELYRWGEAYKKANLEVICPLINNGLKVIAFLGLVTLILPFLSLPERYVSIAHKITTVLLFGAMGWLAIKLINIFERFALQRCALKIKDSLHYRKVHTQITVLKKVAVALVVFLVLVMMLMVSERVRELGATLLASAGIIAAIATFAAQKTLTGVVGGIQIALTQPIHLHDIVLIENEIGQIEEISLSYVVIRLQDERRLIVPVNYFTEKPFQNLSRNTQNLRGQVNLYIHYSVSIDELRSFFQALLDQSSEWDGKVGEMQVVETKPLQMEVRFMISASDTMKLWKLRCDLREKLINYIKENYPKAL